MRPYAHLSLGYRICETPGKLGNFRLFENRHAMHSWRPGWEETFEDTLRLPLGRVGEINPNIHTSRPAQHGVDTLYMICGDKKKPVGDDKDN